MVEAPHSAKDTSGDVNLQQISLEYAITAEFNLFAHQNLPGVYCIPKSVNPREWLGALFIRQGLYQCGIFRFELEIPENFRENSDYKIKFEFPIFHPLIDPGTCVLNATPAFEDVENDFHAYHALIYMQKIFFNVTPENAVNHEAALLLSEDPTAFKERAIKSVQRSREIVYDSPQSEDPHAIKFTPWDPSVHGPIRNRIFQKSSSDDNTVMMNAQTCGLSFLNPNLIFGCDDDIEN